jgi:hypothetical protein
VNKHPIKTVCESHYGGTCGCSTQNYKRPLCRTGYLVEQAVYLVHCQPSTWPSFHNWESRVVAKTIELLVEHAREQH